MRKNEEKKTFRRVKVKFEHFSFIQAYKMLFGKHLYLCLIFIFFTLHSFTETCIHVELQSVYVWDVQRSVQGSAMPLRTH